MKYAWMVAMLVAMVVVGKGIAMLDPHSFKEPIIMASDDSSDDGSSREYTMFA